LKGIERPAFQGWIFCKSLDEIEVGFYSEIGLCGMEISESEVCSTANLIFCDFLYQAGVASGGFDANLQFLASEFIPGPWL
jgi:hypothetical protein